MEKNYPEQMVFKEIKEDYHAPISQLTFQVCRSLARNYDLNLKNLSRVICTANYQEALEEIYSEFCFSSPPTFTQNELGAASGCVVTRCNQDAGEILEHVMILRSSVFSPFFESDKSDEEFNQIIHHMHHELSHIHDYNLRDEQMPGYLNEKIDAYANVLLSPAKSLWDEYFANRSSHPTVTNKSLNETIDRLDEILKHYNQDIIEQVSSYQWGAINLETLHNFLRERILFIFQTFGYSIGYISGLNLSINSFSPETHNLLEESELGNFFYESLEKLDEIYENQSTHWVSLESYQPLMDIVEKYYHSIGVYPSMKNEQLYLSIP
ncbi:hypothetical protein ACEI10_002531 [Vibrio harveyi]